MVVYVGFVWGCMHCHCCRMLLATNVGEDKSLCLVFVTVSVRWDSGKAGW